MSPKVSVLMPNYNCEKYIAQAIESILDQSFTDFEFIIIDDGSTDKSWEIIEEYAKKDPRIVAMRNEKNIWVQNTRNLLFEKAKGGYYALFDSDDISHISRLDKQKLFLDANQDIALLWSNFDVIDSLGKVTTKKSFPENDDLIRTLFFQRNPFGQNTIMVRSECIKKVGWYDPKFQVAEDLDLWIRIGSIYKMHNMQEVLVSYRIHGNNSILIRQKEMIKNTLIIRKNAITLWYKIWFKWYIYYIWSWFMKFLPAKWVLWLFHIITTKNG